MTRNNTPLLLSLPFLALLGLTACGGGDGTVCQLDTDCSSGLLCCKGSSALDVRGVCAVTCSATDAGARDMNVPDLATSDLGSVDGAVEDAGQSEDLGVDDMFVPDDLGEDGGMSLDLGPLDAGELDSGELDAAVSDAAVSPDAFDATVSDAGDAA